MVQVGRLVRVTRPRTTRLREKDVDGYVCVSLFGSCKHEYEYEYEYK